MFKYDEKGIYYCDHPRDVFISYDNIGDISAWDKDMVMGALTADGPLVILTKNGNKYKRYDVVKPREVKEKIVELIDNYKKMNL